MAEFGHAKTDIGTPIISISMAYDTANKVPLFYEEYPGSINDMARFQCMAAKVRGYGCKNTGFIPDRGYFCKDNIEYMDACRYSFVMMTKGLSGFVSDMILEVKGIFEDDPVYGKNVKKRLYAADGKERYFHIYHNSYKEASEREEIEDNKFAKTDGYIEWAIKIQIHLR